MNNYSEIARLIRTSRTIALFPHTFPDGDCVASALALYQVFTAIGKEVCIVCDKPIPASLSALPCAGIFAMGDMDATYDLAFAVDTATPTLLGEAYPCFSRATHSVSIDHHASYTPFAEVEMHHICSANAENIYDFIISEYPTYLNVSIAMCLYTGIVTDSGGFLYPAVNAHTHQVTAHLLTFPFDHHAIYYQHLEKLHLPFVRARSEAYARAIYQCGGSVAVVVFSLELQHKYGICGDDIAGSLVEMMRADEVRVAISLLEAEPQRYRISIRTKEGVSASAIAEYFGGGGHARAAGCRLNGDEGIVIDRLLEAVYKEYDY